MSKIEAVAELSDLIDALTAVAADLIRNGADPDVVKLFIDGQLDLLGVAPDEP